MYPEIVSVVLKVAEAMDGLGVQYFIAGSLASSVHGVARPSQDVDVVAALEPSHAEPLMEALRSEFHYERHVVEWAIVQHGRFGVVHLSRMVPVDVFVAGPDPFARTQLERRRPEMVSLTPPEAAYFCSAEDSILAKLGGYREGARRAQRHWADVLGILRVRGQTLDRPYLGRWADRLDVTDLLRRALYEAGMSPVGE